MIRIRDTVFYYIREKWQTLFFIIVSLILFGQLNFRYQTIPVYLGQIAALFPAVLGEVIIFLSGSIDLSAGGYIALAAAVYGLLLSFFQLPIWLTVILFAVGTVGLGWLKAMLVTMLKADYEIITLIIQFLLVPFADQIYIFSTSQGNSVISFGSFTPLIPAGMVITGAVGWFFLNRTTYGKSIYILGKIRGLNSRDGMNGDLLKRIAVILATLLSSVTAFNLIIRTGAPTYLNGESLTCQILAATAVVGSSSLTGRNAVWRAFMASAIIVIITAIMQLSGLKSLEVRTVYGILILVSFWIRTIGVRRHQNAKIQN